MLHLHVFCLVSAALIGSLPAGSLPPEKTLYLLSLAPFKDDPRESFASRYAGPGARGIVPGVELAVSHINNRSDVLNGFTLDYLSGDSGCAVDSQATESLVKYALDDRERNVAGIVGPVCSAAAETVAGLVGREEVSLIQFTAATSPVLAAPIYGNTIKGLGTSDAFASAFVQLMEQNGWRSVGALYENGRPFFVASHDAFHSTLTASNYSVTSVFISKSSTSTAIEELRHRRLRIIVIFAASDLTSRIVCLSHSKYGDLSYPSYQFFYPDKQPSYLMGNVSFKDEKTTFSCSDAEVNESLSGSVFSSVRLTRKSDAVRLVSGLTYLEYKDQLVQKLSGQPLDDNVHIYYDSVWAIALALNQSIQFLGDNILEYRWSDYNTTAIIRQHLVGLDFQGASGRIYFNGTSKGEPIWDFLFTSLDTDAGSRLSAQDIGTYDTAEDELCLLNGSYFIADEFITNPIVITNSYGIFVLVVQLLILALTLFLHALIFFYQDRRSIKATSPTLSHLIFSGCYLYLVALLLLVVLYTYSSSLSLVVYPVFCSAISWCVPIAFSLIYGTICVKTFRIYHLFMNHTLKRRHGGFLSDATLTVFVMCLVLFDTIVNTIWNVVDPWTQEEQIDFVHSGNVRVICTCNNLPIWFTVLGLHKFVLTVAAIFLAVATRRVDRKEFRSSKSINILTYSLALPYAVGIPLSLVFFTSSIYVSFSVLFLVFSSSVLLCHVLLFLPPLVPIFWPRILTFLGTRSAYPLEIPI